MGGGGSAEVPCGERSSTAPFAGREQTVGQLAVVEGFFWSLMGHADRSERSAESSEPGLGGKLLYIGELDETGRALATAGNVAGAATLAATADASAQKRAIRDGVVDFLVNSLDEALRILKNEIRKREPAAVCVGREPERMEREMRERGVQPDLLTEVCGELRGAELSNRETRIVRAAPMDATQSWLAWGVAERPAQWMPKLDALVLDCVGESERATLRWLRHAPAYMGRGTRDVRVLRCTPEAARTILKRMRDAVESGSIGVPLRMERLMGVAREEHAINPPSISERAH